MRRPCLLVAALAFGCSPKEPPAPAPTSEAPPPRAVELVKIDREAAVRESSALVLARIGDRLRAFVADEDDAAIVEVDLDSGAVAGSTPIAARPRDLLVLPDGRLAATLPDEGAVATFARDAAGVFHETARVRPAPEPTAMALDPTGATLWLTTASSHALVALDAATLVVRSRTDVGREPRAVMITDDGARAIVTHAAETFVTVVPTAGGEPRTVDIGNRLLCRGGGECSGRRKARNAQAIVRLADGTIAVPAVEMLPVPPRGFTKRSLCPPRIAGVAPDLSVKGYGIGNTEAGPPAISDVASLDASGAFVTSKLPPLSGPQCLLPRAAVALGDDLVVACLGSSRVVRYETIPQNAEAWYGDGLHADLKTSVIGVPAGPTALAAPRDGRTLVVWSAFARAVTRVENGKVEKSIAIPRTVPREDAWLRGRELFFTNGDKRISADGRTCGNCHIDGRDDGLAWQTPMGLRRTRLLAGQTHAAPFGWTGENATLEAHVKTTLKNLKGTGLADEDMARLTTYVATLRKPAPAMAELDAEATRGREIFAAAECNNCHAEGASDRIVHDVGTGGAFLTPTLAGVATRGRLMHDGRYRTIDDLLVASTAMGRGATLSADDRRTLVRYLATL